jgi:hypothetical protein
MANPPSLLIDDSIRITSRTTVSSETVETTTVIVTEAEVATTTIIATRIPTSPAIVIVIRTPRSRALYARNQTAAPGSIHQRNNKTKRLDSELETSISSRPRTPETSIRSSAAYTYNMWLV